jgi:hypothetical protein
VPHTHLVEIRHFCYVDEINDGKVLDFLSNAIERLIHSHALTVPVVSKVYNNDVIFFRFDGLVNMPARRKVRKEIRHDKR